MPKYTKFFIIQKYKTTKLGLKRDVEEKQTLSHQNTD